MVHIATNLEFSNDMIALAQGGWAFRGAFPFTMIFRILCVGGTIEWVFRAGKTIEQRAQASKVTIYRTDSSIEELDVDKTDAFLLECKYFVDCVHNNKKVERSTFEDGKSALELALASVNSAKNKKAVNL